MKNLVYHATSTAIMAFCIVVGYSYYVKPSVVNYCGGNVSVSVTFKTNRLNEGDAEYTLICKDEVVTGKAEIVHRYVKAQDKVIRSADFEVNGRI